jgi:hypothetical protein
LTLASKNIKLLRSIRASLDDFQFLRGILFGRHGRIFRMPKSRII